MLQRVRRMVLQLDHRVVHQHVRQVEVLIALPQGQLLLHAHRAELLLDQVQGLNLQAARLIQLHLLKSRQVDRLLQVVRKHHLLLAPQIIHHTKHDKAQAVHHATTVVVEAVREVAAVSAEAVVAQEVAEGAHVAVEEEVVEEEDNFSFKLTFE